MKVPVWGTCLCRASIIYKLNYLSNLVRIHQHNRCVNKSTNQSEDCLKSDQYENKVQVTWTHEPTGSCWDALVGGLSRGGRGQEAVSWTFTQPVYERV